MLSKFSVKKPLTVIVMIMIIAILGGIAYTKMPVELLPNMKMPYLAVVVVSPGSTPDEVEEYISKPVEQSLGSLDNLKKITSNSNENYSMLLLEFDTKVDLNASVIDIQTKITTLKSKFPEFSLEPMIMKVDPTQLPVMNVALSVKNSTINESSEYLNSLKDQLVSVDGVASANYQGLVDNLAVVMIDRDKLKDKLKEDIKNNSVEMSETNMASLLSNLIAGMLNSDLIGKAIYAQNFNMPVGQVDVDGINFLVKIGDKISSYEELNDMSIFSLDIGKVVSNNILTLSLFTQEISAEYVDFAFDLTDSNSEIRQGLSKLREKFENFSTNPYFEKIGTDYKIKRDYIKSLSAISGLNNALNKIQIPAELIDCDKLIIENLFNGIEINNSFSDFKTQLLELRTFIKDNENNLFVKDDATSTYKISPNILSTLGVFNSVGEDLDNIVISEKNLNHLINNIKGIEKTCDSYSIYTKTFKKILDNPTYFQKVYDDNDVLTGYKFLFTSLEKVKPISLKLSDISNVMLLNSAQSQNTIINGNPGVIVSIYKQSTASTVNVVNNINNKLKQIQKTNPNFNYLQLVNQGESITNMLNTILVNLIIGGIVAIIVLFVFLRKIKPTLIVGMSIVVSVITAFVLMYLCGITLNVISMGGLAIGVGMLVDNSIVVVENIYRLRNEGLSRYKACVKGAKQVSGAIIASTITTVIIFVPIMFINGITKEMFKDLALTITFSLVASLLVALSFVPMAMSKTDKEYKEIKEFSFFKKIRKFYMKVLDFFLDKKWIVIVTVVVLFGSSLVGALCMRQVFFPQTDTGYITINASINKDKLPEGMTYEKSIDEYINYVNDTLKQDGIKDYVKDVGIYVNNSLASLGLDIDLGNKTIITNIALTSKRRPKSYAIVEKIKEKMADIKVLPVNSFSQTYVTESTEVSSVNSDKLYIEIDNGDINSLRKVSQDLENQLRNIKGVESLDNGLGDVALEYKLVIKKDNKQGIYVAQAIQAMQKVLAIKTSNTTLKFAEDNKSYQVYVYDSDYRLERWYKAKTNFGDEVKIMIEGEKGQEKYTYQGKTLEKISQGRYTYNDILGYQQFLTVEGNNPIVYYDLKNNNDFDLITYEISTSMILPNIDKPIDIKVPIFKILDDESFVKDSHGRVIYRTQKDNFGNVIYQKNGTNFVLDEYGEKVPVYQTLNGEKIPLAVKKVNSAMLIKHINSKPVVSITLDAMQSANNNKIVKECNKIVSNYKAPNDIKINVIGSDPLIKEAYATMLWVLLVGVFLIYLVMVAQFQSFIMPLIIMVTVPIAFAGSVFAMIISGKPISIIALVGLIILMGIVVNNGIVFVDYVNKLRENGMSKRDAIKKTGKDRLRPILMTASTTIFAMFIMAFDSSAYGTLLQPMAITTIGGLILATVLTLFFVPVIYDLVIRDKKKNDEESEDKSKAFNINNKCDIINKNISKDKK